MSNEFSRGIEDTRVFLSTLSILFRSLDLVRIGARSRDIYGGELIRHADADVNATGANRRTALIYAAFEGHHVIVKMLLDEGAEVDAADSAGVTALLAAHFLAGGTLTIPIFIVVYILMLSQLKGTGRLTGLVSFVIVGCLVVTIVQNLWGQSPNNGLQRSAPTQVLITASNILVN